MKSRLPIIWLILLFLIIKTLPVFCQQMIFNKVLPPEGKSFGMVTCIKQDINGYMWFATPNGLYKYDGYRYISYVHDSSDSHSLANDYIETINTDTDGLIWVGTNDTGLDRLDPETGIFTHFRHDVNVPSSLGNDSITAILIDKQGILWIGTYKGLDQFDPKKNKFIHYRYNANDSTSISNNLVQVIYEDRQGTIWIGTGIPGVGDRPEEGGLNRMNKKTGTFTRYLNIPGNIHSLANNKVKAIFEDNQGVLWIGTAGNVLHKMDRNQGVFERIVSDPLHPEKLSGPALTKEATAYEHITFITQDAAGSYWIGTVAGGLNYHNPVIGKTINYKESENSSAGFNDDGAWCTFTSRDGILWISGTWVGGILYRIDPFRREIPHYTIPNGAYCFYEEPNGIFWTGGYNLIRNEIDKGITKRYFLTEGGEIRIIKEDPEGNFWIGTTGGLKLFNKRKENFITYKNDPGNTNSLSNSWVNTIYVDRDSNLWIGTYRGFNLRNHKTGSFTQYLYTPGDTRVSNLGGIPAILRDKTGKLWIGTWGYGVNLFNQESYKFKNYLMGTQVSCLFEDADGALWLGGNGGLYTFDRSADAFIRFKVSGSFTDIPDVSHMVEDNQKYLWLQTSNGMMSVNPRRNETRNYGIGPTNFDFKNRCYKGRDGKLYFTESGGYYSFYPADFTQHIKPPEIIFTGFRLADQLIKPGNQGPLKESISKTTEIRLRYNQNVFSFEFAAIDYTNPENNRHLFMLENYDNNWQTAGPDRKASYFNILPGKYVFRVKATNSKGAWAEKKINIIIQPPWWRTWWAYLLFALVFIIALFSFVRWRISSLKKEKKLLEEKVVLRTQQLKEEKEKVESSLTELKATQNQLIQSEKMASLGELTAGIAHEIQNPLNFVNNFSEVNKELIGELQDERKKESRDFKSEDDLLNDIKENEVKINHHGKRADAIVKGMLLHSKTSTGKKEPTDINALADEYLRLAFHGLRAKEKSFNAMMKKDYSESVGKINIIPQDIGRVLLNLYNNAFYAVNEKNKVVDGSYEPTVSVSTRKMDNKIEIRVKDNGNGIPQKILDKIFQPFFTTKPTGQGTGLGLSLSYDIIKAHGGEIKVETVEGQYTEFIVLLPY